MFTTSIVDDAQELTDFRIKQAGMMEFGHRLEAR